MKVLVAVDGSATALKATKCAVSMFPTSGLTLINVQMDEHLRSLQGRISKAVVDDYLKEMHDNDLKDSKVWLDAQGVNYDVVIADGALAPTLARYAEDGGYSAIVVGSKGRGTFADLLIGSTVHRLISISKVPVVVVP
jgi:nucleotide-binding universal stress UspA family protein